MGNLADTNAKLYLDLLEKVLTDYHRFEYGEYEPITRFPGKGLKFQLGIYLDSLIQKANPKFRITRENKFNEQNRLMGKDWPTYAETMVGLTRIKNVRSSVENVIKSNIEGDMMETGVWRGGSTIMMRATLKAHGVENKTVWVADSFEGLPAPNVDKYEADKGDLWHTYSALAVSLDQVKHNFEKYGMLDDQVKFLKGWFKDTMPTAPVQKLSLLRLDGDMYESTIDVLKPMYPKLSVGGYIIIDDYELHNCRKAVDDYRKEHNITEKIQKVDDNGVFWIKER